MCSGGGEGPLSFAAALVLGTPIASDFAESGFTAFTGRDFLSDETVSGWQRGLAAADVFLTVFGGPVAKAGGSLLDVGVTSARRAGRAGAVASRFVARQTVRGIEAGMDAARTAGHWAGKAAHATVAGARSALDNVRRAAAQLPIGPSGDGHLRLASRRAGALFPKAQQAAKAAENAATRVSVLGTYLPNPSTGKTYVQFAEEIGARRFALPPDKFTNLVQRAETVHGNPLHYNQLYLDSIVKRRDLVRLNISRPEMQTIIQSNPNAFRTLRWEIDDLMGRGYSWGDDLKSLVPPTR